MTPEVTLGAIVLIPVVLLMLLRINATLVFLSLCLGSVLVQFVSPEASTLVTKFAGDAAQSDQLKSENISIGLLVLPAVLTALFMIKTVQGKFKLVLNLLPSIGVGLLGGLLVVPLLPPGLATNIIGSPLGAQVENLQNLIVGSSALICLFVLWLQRPKTGGHEKHGKHHK